MKQFVELKLFLVVGLVLVSGFITGCDSPTPTPSTAIQIPIVGTEGNSAESAYPADSSSYPSPTSIPLPGDVPFFLPPVDGIPSFPGKIAFQTEMFGLLEVAMLDGSSGELTRLTTTDTQAFEPSWSPDCSAFAYTREVGSNDNFEILIQDIASGQSQVLVTEPGIYSWSPAWSPNGEVIAYQNNPEAMMNICFVTPDGERLGCMERGTYSNAMPSWSPDGTQLVFGSNREGNWELYVTDYPAMSSLTRLTNNSDIDFHPKFSPDGQWVVFTSQRLGSYSLYLVRPDGQGERPLTTLSSDERDPAWIGNDRIAFAANLEDDWELYITDLNGVDWQRLTYVIDFDRWPAWCSNN